MSAPEQSTAGPGPSIDTQQTSHDRQVGWWLLFMAGLIFLMVLVGGITRLTDSGLSITEWKPIMGALPPMSEAAWLEAFEKYKQIPEYVLVNAGMSLAEFKFIFFWEWFHRLIGRFIGVAFALPLIYFLVAKKVRKERIPALVGLFFLGGAQGALGWFMVMSGLSERVDVSQYRLTAHLGLAVVLFIFMMWAAFIHLKPKANTGELADMTVRRLSIVFVGLVFVQILLGGFVAGLDAGIGFNTWPLMDGAIIPSGLFAGGPFWVSAFEHNMTVQFNHRMVAYLVVVMAGVLAFVALKKGQPEPRRTVLLVLLGAVFFQVLLGILTLVYFVPLWLGVSHQGGALVVLGAGLYFLYLLPKAEKA